MVIDFLRELRTVWRRQHINWRAVVTRQVFNRFFEQLTTQYSNIYILQLGASPVELGAVNSASGLGTTLISMPLGYFQDRYSVRKIYLMGVALMTLVPLLYAVAYRWELIAPAILISGIGIRLGSCVVICDLSLPNTDRATGRALCEGLGALPKLFAPMVAAVIITWFGGISVEGIRPLYWVQFIACVILFIYVAVKLTDITRQREINKISPLSDFKDVFQRGEAVKRWLLFQSLSTFTDTMITIFLFPYAYEVKGSSQFIIGGIATAMILTDAIVSTPLGRLADRIGRKRIFYALTPFFCLANVLFILAPSPKYLLLVGFLLGFRRITMLAYGSMTPELVPRDCIGRWRGLINFCRGMADMAAPIVGGFIWEHIEPGWIFIIPIFVDLFVRIPLLHTVPETLQKQ